MNIRSAILIGCLIISTACLGSAYLVAGYWQIVPALIILVLFWIFINNQSMFWSASSVLVSFVILAVIGIALNLSAIPMIITCSSALASWDLLLFNRNFMEYQLGKTHSEIEQQHLKSLSRAAFIGLILAFLSSYLYLEISFGVIVFLVLMAIGCLLYGTKFIHGKYQ